MEHDLECELLDPVQLTEEGDIEEASNDIFPFALSTINCTYTSETATPSGEIDQLITAVNKQANLQFTFFIFTLFVLGFFLMTYIYRR